jgi:hypothetical protein
MRWRAATRSARVLPDFLVLSAGRCGSTSLFATLCTHPQVLAPSHKELHFFDRRFARDPDPDSYRRFFPTGVQHRARERRLGRPVLCGEATTYYLLHPAVPARIRAMLPGLRLVVILRDPVVRALSHYHLVRRAGRETMSFEEALDAEEERLAGEEERLLADPSYDSHALRYQAYVARGLYLPQLQRWEKEFPAERFLVVRSEDFFADPAGVTDDVSRFLGLEPHPGPLPKPRNRATYEPMRPETRERLCRVFAEPNRQLEAHLGRDLHWSRPSDAVAQAAPDGNPLSREPRGAER